MLKRLKGQGTLEYALIIAVVVGALLAMRTYMTRSVQGKLREATDDIGSQYSAGNVTAKYITKQDEAKVTKESFGTTAVGGEGVSKTEVTQAAQVEVTTDTKAGGKAEQITTTFRNELDTQGLFGDKK